MSTPLFPPGFSFDGPDEGKVEDLKQTPGPSSVLLQPSWKDRMVKLWFRERDAKLFIEARKRAEEARLEFPNWILAQLESLILGTQPTPTPSDHPISRNGFDPASENSLPKPGSADELMYEHWSPEERREKGYRP